MSVTHIRKPKRLFRRDFRVEAAIGAAIVLLICLIALGRLRIGFLRPSGVTASGQVMGTRIAVYSSGESSRGGYTLYRIEADVKYDLSGQAREVWMPASEVSDNRDELAVRLVRDPKACEVYWAPHHPENPKCLFK
jgi:hypothetical protein